MTRLEYYKVTTKLYEGYPKQTVAKIVRDMYPNALVPKYEKVDGKLVITDLISFGSISVKKFYEFYATFEKYLKGKMCSYDIMELNNKLHREYLDRNRKTLLKLKKELQ